MPRLHKLSYMFIMLGILMILFPTAREWNEDREQNELLKAAELIPEKSEAIWNPGLINNYDRLSTRFAEIPVSDAQQEAAFPIPEPIETEDQQTPIATIRMSRIDLKLPVLEGATRKNMRHAAVHMPETGALGQMGNAAIAAHRARTHGRLFNRLNEVKIGDEIVVNTRGENYVYKVFNIKVVAPTDVSVLKSFNKQKLLTLITCDPPVKPTHRLIVQAKQST
ncbi:class D sortase [Paenibacillus sp. 8b26]|uniref:class D sortase n=1 Tax=Paenibacillus sp. 8b26 TaxID=3424133 RepID=UPI003D65B247